MPPSESAARTNSSEVDWDSVTECEPRVRSIALRLTSDPEEAKEVVQDTVLRLSTSLRRYRRGNFDGWLYRVTRNVFLDRCRRRSRVHEIALAPLIADRTAGPDLVEEAGDREDVRREVRAALLQLPDSMRTPIVLRDIEGLSYQEIGDLLDLSMGTVRSRIHRGRERLRVLLTPYMRSGV